MKFQEKRLYHQIHPVKLATDIIAAIYSSVLFWDHQLWRGIIANLLPPIIASLLIITFIDLWQYKKSSFGKYIKKYMTAPAEAVRFAGNIIMVMGAWYHSIAFVCVALVLIILVWMRGMFPGMKKS